MAQFRSKPFGVTQNGDKVDEYIISNPGGLEISVLNYGCVIKNLFVPTKTGYGGCGRRARHPRRL